MSNEPSSHVVPASDTPARGDEPTAAPGDRGASPANGQSDASPGQAQSGEIEGPIDSQKTVISKRPPVSPPSFRRAANPFEMGETLEGEQLGHFQLEEFVGGGGMGAVFRATDTMLGRTVAVKVVSRDQTNEDTLRRFKNEAQSAARLDHPNIARVYYVGEDKGWNYIVFEYIEGVNVRDLVDHDGPLALEDAINYTLQVAEALEHASQREVTHRDIKPSNILIMIDGRAKLVDMGLARLQQVESSTDDLTASGVTLGTFDYISPEQARDPRNTDVRSDLYSLGCTLFFMLTGQPPFPDGTVLQKLLSHSSDDPPDLWEYRPDLDEEVAHILNRLLAKQPEQRFQSPRELIGEMLLMADRLDLSAIRAQSTVWFTHSDQKPAWWVRHLPWGAAVLALLGIVLIYSMITSSGSNPIPTPGIAATLESESVGDGTTSDDAGTELRKSVAPPPKVDVTEGTTETDDAESEIGTPTESPTATAAKSTPAANANSEDSATEVPSTKVEQESGPIAVEASDAMEVGPSEKTSPAADPSGIADSSGSSNASMPRSDRVDVETQLVVVGEQATMGVNGAIVVSTLADALSEVAKSSKPAEIELWFDGLRWLEPLLIDTNECPENRLTIRAARGMSPVLAFRPATDARRTPASSMIDIIGGNVSWQGVHFYLEMPETRPWRETRSLLQLDSTDRTEFHDCTFTLRNANAQGTATGQNVAFVDIVGPGGIGGVFVDSLPLAGDAPTLWLKDCIVRGQAPFVRAEFAVPFLFSWEHGLFVSTQRLVEVGGTNLEPRWEHGGVNILLQSLLCVADQGICLVRSDHIAPYQLGVFVQCDDCLFATKATTPPVPLYVFRAGSAFPQSAHPLKIDGSRNYYKNTQVVLRVESNGDGSQGKQFIFDDLTVPGAPSWFKEENPEPVKKAVFSWETPSQSVDRQSLHDFIPPSIGDGWFTRALALSPSQLPRLPDIRNMVSELTKEDSSSQPPPEAKSDEAGDD